MKDFNVNYTVQYVMCILNLKHHWIETRIVVNISKASGLHCNSLLCKDAVFLSFSLIIFFYFNAFKTSLQLYEMNVEGTEACFKNNFVYLQSKGLASFCMKCS